MVKDVCNKDLGKGIIIMLIAMNLFNFLNFLFHFIMGRLLAPAEYGVLAVLMSLIYLYGIPTQAITNILSKYTTKFKHQEKKLNYIIKRALRKSFFIGILIFVIFLFISVLISDFLDINIYLILITNFFILFSFIAPVLRGVLQGKKEFGSLGLSLVLEGGLKLIASISLVLIGWGVFGSMVGVVIGSLIALGFLLLFNKNIFHKDKQEKTSINNAYKENIHHFITVFIVWVALTLDIFLAKRFFSDHIAGQYSVLSMMGKVIFFATTAISQAMFPITSENCHNNKDSHNIFLKSLVITALLSFIAIVGYLLIPELIIKIFYGSKYLMVAPNLVYSAAALAFLSLTNLVLFYGLSTEKLKNSFYLFIFLIVEIVLLSIFNSSISEYILAFMFSNAIMFIASFFFLKKNERQEN